MAVLLRLGNPALLTAQERYPRTPVSRDGHRMLALAALVMHQINFTGAIGGFALDVTYNLTVTR